MIYKFNRGHLSLGISCKYLKIKGWKYLQNPWKSATQIKKYPYFLLVMIPKDKEYRLIKIYMYICDMYEQSLKYHCQRYSNNSKPLFSDEEILTIYFFVGHELLFHQEPVLSWTKASHGRISQERASSSSVPDSALSCLREWPEGLPERMHAGSFQQEDLRWQDIPKQWLLGAGKTR